MALLLNDDLAYALPHMNRVRQNFDTSAVTDVRDAVKDQIMRPEIRSKVIPGMRVAVAVGSRGIANIDTTVRSTVDCLKQLGADPFILSAMGSHGGGTPEGQRDVFAGYRINEESMGVPVVTNVESTQIGSLADGLPIYFDTVALSADMIVPINRIKLHTDFVGSLQSGLSKMLVIGLGNQLGCSTIHERAPECFSDIIEEAARIIMKQVIRRKKSVQCVNRVRSGNALHCDGKDDELWQKIKFWQKICLISFLISTTRKRGKQNDPGKRSVGYPPTFRRSFWRQWI